MKIFKISQNIEYLGKLGIPPESQQEMLDYLMSLDKDIRKIILRKIRQTPTMDLGQIKELETDTKKDYLRGQGYDESVVDVATTASPKYAVWFAREIKKFREEGVKIHKNLVDFWRSINKKYNLPFNTSDAWELMSQEEKEQDRKLRYNKGIKLDPTSPRFQTAAPWENQNEIIGIIDYIEQNDPDIMSMSYEQVKDDAVAWHAELKMKADEEAKEYKTHNVVYTLTNGWEIVKLSGGDCEPEGNNMGHCSGGYSQQVEEGTTSIYSLRDPQNKPHATIEMNMYETKENKADEPGGFVKPDKKIEIIQIQGKGNDEPIPEYKTMIKDWFEVLKGEGYEFDPMDGQYYSEKTAIKDLRDELDREDEYGIPIAISGIGDDAETYYDNLTEAYNEGVSGSYWIASRSTGFVDDIIEYAEKNKELNQLIEALEGFSSKGTKRNGTPIDTWKGINEWANEAWLESEDYYPFDNPRPDEDEYPQKEDFMIQPQISEEQPELGGMPEPQQILNEEAYNQAVKEYQEQEKAYEEELTEYQNNFEPFEFSNYVYKALEEAKQRNKPQEQGIIEEKVAKMKTRIYKMATKETLSAEETAQYVDALTLYAQEHPSLDKKYAILIEKLPSSRKIIVDFSNEECKVLYETLDYLWKKITGEHIIQEKEIISAPETLFGNYWLLKNGILLKGVNHFTIIKNNASLFCALLNLNGMTLQEYLSNKPHKAIEFILNNGGVRLFINKDKKLYAQMSSKTYGKFGKQKVKKYDFKSKIVKIIDFKSPYNGWKSGITIKL